MGYSPVKTPYGSWKSPFSADIVAQGAIGFQELCCEGETVYWTETRPEEKGRSALVSSKAGDLIKEMSVRSRVHEYGGGALHVFKQHIYFSHGQDNLLYKLSPERLLFPLVKPSQKRYADVVVSPDEKWLICVCEEHFPNGKVDNYLLKIDLNHSEQVDVIASGHDFYSSPRLSPDGQWLAWICWDFPNMPWDNTSLWVAKVSDKGFLENPVLIAGGNDCDESLLQPSWSPSGILHVISDRSGWWNLYRWDRETLEALCSIDAEFALPPWVFNRPTYAFLKEGQIACVVSKEGIEQLALLNTDKKHVEAFSLPYTAIRNVCVNQSSIFFFGASPTEPNSLIQLDLASHTTTALKKSFSLPISLKSLSLPQAIKFPSTLGESYAFYYPPHNPDYSPPDGAEIDPPPLLVKCHGGPTGHVGTALNLETQFWTSRGFAVIDVNYSGSSGYGRAYRKRLEGQWGIVDVQDCIRAALTLVDKNLADRHKLLIKGGSAGGYTVLCALAFHNVFAAGTSYYGVSDPAALIATTHKFEAHYLDLLIGRYPEQKNLYTARSPLHHATQISSPVLLLQGKEDPVVPLSQAEELFSSLKNQNKPVSLIVFDNEQHGFRMASTVKQSLESELLFYSNTFSIDNSCPTR